MKNQERITNLFKRYISNQCSAVEEREILDLLSSNEYEILFKELIVQELKQDSVEDSIDSIEIQKEISDVRERIIQHISETDPQYKPFRTRLWFKVSSAAALLLCTSVALFFYMDKRNKLATQHHFADIAPGRQKATLTLADGSKVILDETANGNVANQAGVSITKTYKGQLVYTVTGTTEQSSQVIGKAITELSNTISTPRGGQYQINLPDGTRVWLNAASSLKFPLSFVKLNERRVELKGEAYFEVKKDAARPFFVQSDKQTVSVLGTHFNINSYADEPYTKTTLLEGSVKVVTAKGLRKDQAILSPGQQARIRSVSSQVNVINVDPLVEIAWKDGLFFFENEPIENIMKKIARWYDVEVVYEDDVAGKTVWGSVTRYANVSKVLSILERTGGIHFKIEGRRIIVRK